MTLGAIPFPLLLFLRLWALLLFFLCLVVGVRALFLRVGARRLAPCVALTALGVLLLQVLLRYGYHGTRVDWLPAPMFAALLAAESGALAGAAVSLQRWQAGHISGFSVQQALDRLPAGICCFDRSGRVVLLNGAMASLCVRLFGSRPIDGHALWDAITERCAAQGTDNVAILEDGSAWLFRLLAMDAEGLPLFEIDASDITSLYRANDELERRNARLAAINRRLREYSRELEAAVRGREMFQARMALHDEVGMVLLTTRWAVDRPGEVRQENVLSLWEDLSALLQADVRPAAREGSLFESLIEAAESIGVRVEIDGPLPEEGPARAVIARGLHTCITNVRKHAGGSRLFLRLRRESGTLSALFTNDGTPPAGPVYETGGLRSLRLLVEAEGGAMTVRSSPAFSCEVVLPDR